MGQLQGRIISHEGIIVIFRVLYNSRNLNEQIRFAQIMRPANKAILSRNNHRCLKKP